MIRKIGILCLLAAFMLTGCGQEGLVMQQVAMDKIERLDSEQEVMEAQEKLPRQDSGKWSYRQENIKKLVDMENRIKESCENDKTSITVNGWGTVGIASANMWAQHLALGRDAKEEKITGLDILLEMQDKETLTENCKRIAQLGFDCLNNYSPDDVAMIQKGCQLFVVESSEEDGDAYYSIEIKVPGILAFGPERYFDLFDTCVESNLFIENFVCDGGAVDAIRLYGDDLAVQAFLKDGKILEMAAARYNWKGWAAESFLQKEYQAGFSKLLSRMCDDSAQVATVVNELIKEGEEKGTLGDFRWDYRIVANEEGYFYIR